MDRAADLVAEHVIYQAVLLDSRKRGESVIDDLGTPVIEARALARSGLFTNLELLRMWSVTTPQAIFPKRKIGELDEGYEASFLVLRADPLADFKNTGAITLRVKQGVPLRPTPEGGTASR